MTSSVSIRGLAAASALAALAACARPAPPIAAPIPLPQPPAPQPPPAVPVGLPPIPAVDGPLAIRVVHPPDGSTRPGVDSTYIYGSVGTGRATLTINGSPVPVAPNGAFLAYLPVPPTAWELRASAGGVEAVDSVPLRTPARGGEGAAPATESFATPRVGTITGGADTLATGSDVTVGRPTPAGTYRWFLPRGARVAVTGRRADQLRVALDTATAWVDASAVALGDGPPPATPVAAALTAHPAAGWVDYRVAAPRAPFHVEAIANGLVLSVYGAEARPTASLTGDPLVSGVEWSGSAPARLTVRLDRPVWGYRAFYAENGDLVLRVRRPPAIDLAAPLRGVRIVVDPGHPPAGATGPTGLTEAEANLAIGLRLADQLRARGALVTLTRTANVPSSTAERVALAVAADAHLLVSVHNNAFGEGVNPFRNAGTSTYYFHPFSAALARELVDRIAGVTRIPNQGARWSNLALARPTWMPSALTESLYMLIPEQEAALRDPGFLDRLAQAHVLGIENFLRVVAAR